MDEKVHRNASMPPTLLHLIVASLAAASLTADEVDTPIDAGRTNRIVYVVDASGSMMDLLPFLLVELRRAINALDERHSFAVIFFQHGRAVEASTAGLKVATRDEVRKTLDWLSMEAGNLRPEGSSDPLAAIELALAYQPDLVHLVSDDLTGTGRFELSQERLTKAIQKLNTRKVKFNCVQCIRPDRLNTVPGLKSTLEQIAIDSSGRYRFVSLRELGLD